MTGCSYYLAWRGPCGSPVVRNARCGVHLGFICCSCGTTATRECDHAGSFVCGAPLCGQCEHVFGGTHGGKVLARAVLTDAGLTITKTTEPGDARPSLSYMRSWLPLDLSSSMLVSGHEFYPLLNVAEAAKATHPDHRSDELNAALMKVRE